MIIIIKQRNLRASKSNESVHRSKERNDWLRTSDTLHFNKNKHIDEVGDAARSVANEPRGERPRSFSFSYVFLVKDWWTQPGQRRDPSSPLSPPPPLLFYSSSGSSLLPSVGRRFISSATRNTNAVGIFTRRLADTDGTHTTDKHRSKLISRVHAGDIMRGFVGTVASDNGRSRRTINAQIPKKGRVLARSPLKHAAVISSPPFSTDFVTRNWEQRSDILF